MHARRTTFFSLSYRYFFAPPHKLPFSVDFPCFMRPTSAINVIASDPSPPPAHLFLTIYSLYVTFLAKNTFRPGQLLMNADPAGFFSSTSMLCFLLFFFRCFRNEGVIRIKQNASIGRYEDKRSIRRLIHVERRKATDVWAPLRKIAFEDVSDGKHGEK